MPVERRVEPSEPFDVIQWTGANLGEIIELTGLTPRSTCGILTLDLGPDQGDVVVVLQGWWVIRRLNGSVAVASERTAARWLDPAAA